MSATATALATGDTSEFSANHVANTAPVNTVPATATVNEDTAFAFTGANTISVADAQSNVAPGRADGRQRHVERRRPRHGRAAAALRASRSPAPRPNINASLATLAYQGILNYNGADTLTVVSTDAGGMTDSDNVAITVNPVNDAPVNTVPAAQAVNEDAALVFSAGNANQVLDRRPRRRGEPGRCHPDGHQRHADAGRHHRACLPGRRQRLPPP